MVAETLGGGGEPSAAGGERVAAAARRAGPALLLFAGIRGIGVLCVAGWARHTGRHPRTLLGASWDSQWYLSIAQHGYGSPAVTRTWPQLPAADLAFFPLYPWLVRALRAAVPLGAASAGLLVAWAAALAAAWGIFAVGERLHGRRTGVLLVALWALLPHAVVESMAYTEPLLTALAAWSLYALLTRRPVWAGALAALAGLARPSALASVAAVELAVVAVAWRQRRPDGRAGGRVPPGRLWAAALLAPTGWLAYVLWVGWHTGHGPLGYLDVQALWGSRFDLGRDTLRAVRRLVLTGAPPAYCMALAVVAVALLLYALLVADRPPAAVLGYVTVLVVLALGGTHYFASKPRFLLPAFPLLLPAARALAGAHRRTTALLCGALAALSSGYGAYLLTVAAIPL
ncbi:hypothetical protein ACFC0M_34530 [Streptomyces sp. NPDC056149]|uniref:hypothetical protein n=1 Tax=Streptomyces sp. NPDC056149 TaxID=3345728 RepID=UPI0035DBAC9E